ncbi:MAG: hypothetical protein GC190_14635 [Alphaproteobacteria bacterium]|nr:hypothetical protein [Alphaproteobacteria bacterium]
MKPNVAIVVASLAALQALPARAEDVHGRIELADQIASEGSASLSAALGEQNRNDVLGDVRLTWEPRWDEWSFAVHYQVTADVGDTPDLIAKRNALAIFPMPPPATWWDLTDTFVDDQNVVATQRIDRLWIGYTGANLVVRVGRQALTWGSGLVFRPMDLFDPFAPTAIDTEYKPGTDVVYAQWLFDDGSDLQFVAAPRPKREGGEPTSNASSFALHFQTAIGDLHTTWLVARDHSDWVAGVGVGGSLGGASWNVEVLPTFVNNEATRTSAIANISDATKVFDRDVTLFAEYYRNGFGLSAKHYALADLSAPLIDRLLRGQVYNTGRDYVAAGATVQWTPLFQISPTLIVNLNDASAYGIVQATYSLRENLNLVVGAQLPIGPARTEFGGIPLAGITPPDFEQPAIAYVQLRQYF